jgi:uncharacterized membrane protein
VPRGGESMLDFILIGSAIGILVVILAYVVYAVAVEVKLDREQRNNNKRWRK